MSEDPELERRLDAMFGSLKPRAEFEAQLRQRLRGRRRWWSQPALLWLAAAVPALILAFAFLAQLPHTSNGATSSSSGQKQTEAAPDVRGAAVAPRFACPSPVPPLSAEPAQAATPSPSPTPCP